MKLFWGGKKKSTEEQFVTPSGDVPFEVQLQAANEDLYKHSVELVAKNKTLSLLGRLYEISVLALEPKDLALRLCQTIQRDFEFELVGILRYQTSDDVLEPLAFAQSAHFESIQADGSVAYQPKQLFICKQSDFFKRVILEKRMSYSEDFTEICGAQVTIEAAQKIYLENHIRSSLVYPLVIEGGVIGLLVLCFNRVFHDLADFEKQAIESFVNVVAVALDKTFLYEQLAKANKELSVANERQSNLIHFIGHEVKGFLTKDIAAFSELVEGDYGTLPDAAHKLAEGALAQSRDGARAVTDLLEASNLKEGTVHYTMVLFDFKEAFLEVVEKLRPVAEKKGLQYMISVDETARYMVRGDKGQLQDHVLRNMIENAINYTKEGSVILSLISKDETLVLTIKDTGVGISSEDMPHLFTEGGHGKDAIKVNVNSTGYGLFIVKNIVNAHNGTITAQSEGEGKGATFTMALPLVAETQ